jgi:hypothetical protein
METSLLLTASDVIFSEGEVEGRLEDAPEVSLAYGTDTS